MMNGDDTSAIERQSLLSRLLDAIKQCQIRFGGRTELATESDSRVVCLCAQFEAMFQHGIRKKVFSTFRQVTEIVRGLNLRSGEGEPSFWNLVTTVLNRHEYERYMLLKNISTDMGRGRAWLRSALNEHSLERYMHMILADTSVISQYYEDWAFLMDQESSSMLPMMAAGLGSILFAINIDNPDLNTPCIRHTTSTLPLSTSVPAKPELAEPQPVFAHQTGSVPGGKKKKKKKRPTSQFVSFDDDEAVSSNEALSLKEASGSYSSSQSAPPTCLSSPVSSECLEEQRYNMLSNAVSNSSMPSPSTTRKGDNTEANVNTPDLSDTCKDHVRTIDINVEASNPVIDTSSSSSSEVIPTSQRIPNNAVESSEPVTISISKKYQNLRINEQDASSPDSKGPSADPSSFPRYNNLRLSERYLNGTVLTPLGDPSVGDLIPVPPSPVEDIPSSEDSVSIPSYGEDTENAAAALAFAQKIAAWASTTPASDSGTSHSQLSTEKGLGSEPRSRADTLTMNIDELREALSTVMQRKEEVEEKNSSLRSLLDREMEISAALRAEMDVLQQQTEERVKKLETTIQTLTRENDVLKHQLKKYIAAVQMLKRDSGRAQENFSGIIGEIQPAIPEPKCFIDHQYEASEYEKKLVQVAEMHGELMEFNDRLHKLLLQKEATIRRLKEELIDLRGPLPDDNQTSDDDVSVTSDYDASSQTAFSRPLINIWIPSAFLTGRASDIHHVYQMYVRIRDEEWNIYRRYAQFYAFHKVLKKKHPIVNTFDFPPKKTIGSKDAKVVEERRKRIQHYMRCVVNWLLQSNVDLANNPDRETLLTLLPFLGDSNNSTEHKSQAMVRTGSRLRLPTSGASSQSSQLERPSQHYMGL